MPTRIGKDGFVVSSFFEGRSKPVPKTGNDCFHQSWLTWVNRPVHTVLNFLILQSPKMTIQDMQRMFHFRIYVFFTLFGYWALGGGVSQGIGTEPAYVAFHLGQLKN